MSRIKVERRPSPERLKELGVLNWPIWTKEASEFPWTYDEPETCYFLDGEVTVTGEETQNGVIICHKHLTPCVGLVFRQNHYITARSLWGFLLAVISSFYRTGLGVGGLNDAPIRKYFDKRYNTPL